MTSGTGREIEGESFRLLRKKRNTGIIIIGLELD